MIPLNFAASIGNEVGQRTIEVTAVVTVDKIVDANVSLIDIFAFSLSIENADDEINNKDSIMYDCLLSMIILSFTEVYEIG